MVKFTEVKEWSPSNMIPQTAWLRPRYRPGLMVIKPSRGMGERECS